MISKELLLKMGAQAVRVIKAEELWRILDREEMEYIFKCCNAFWHHPGEKDIKAPHVRLTTGKHSDIFVNCPKVLCYSGLCQIMAFQLVSSLYDVAGDEIDKISWVTGSDSSALAIAKDVANILGVRFHPMQKVKAGKDEFQVWEKMVIREEEVVLHIEELITTSTTSIRVRRGIREAHEYEINFFPYLPVLVFRPQKGKDISTIDKSKVVPALSYETFVVDPKEEECPLCAKGSKDLPAKGKNWEKLISSM